MYVHQRLRPCVSKASLRRMTFGATRWTRGEERMRRRRLQSRASHCRGAIRDPLHSYGLKVNRIVRVIRVHDTRHVRTTRVNLQRMCVCWVPGACMGYGARCVHGATGALHDGGMGEADAVQCGAASGDVRYAHGWGMVPVRSTGAGLPPLPPGAGAGVGVREGRGLPTTAVGESRPRACRRPAALAPSGSRSRLTR